MIDRKRLLDDLKPLLKQLEADLRARCDEVPAIDTGLRQEYQQAKDAGRTGDAFEAWRADLITQVAAAWVLSCVFVRFLEDNALVSPPRISGPLHGAGDGGGMMRARDERDLYFRDHPTDTDRDCLLAVFDDLAKLPGAKDIFGPHNLVNAYRDWLSGDAAQKLIEFFQKIDQDETGELIHDFTDPITPTGGWDTRFLGDLYQDLSEAARKKYALLQTPVFVEEFILERTLEPAIDEFGLEGFKMIDPACGSGHFLLGAFARVLARWRRQEPGTRDRELVNRALGAVHGVDLNAYAIAIARFRLLIRAMRNALMPKHYTSSKRGGRCVVSLPLVPLDAIATFVGCDPTEVREALAVAGIYPTVDTEAIGPQIGYEPSAVERWLAAQMCAPTLALSRLSVGTSPLSETAVSAGGLLDDATLIDFELAESGAECVGGEWADCDRSRCVAHDGAVCPRRSSSVDDAGYCDGAED